MRRLVIGSVLAAAFVGVLWFATLQQARVTCDVCIAFEGRQACESAAAVDRERALMQATTSACAQLSSGVTAGIRCNGTPPLSSRCSP